MDKFISFIFIALIILVFIFVINFISDLLVILFKKLFKKIRSSLGLPNKEEVKKEVSFSDETPSKEEKSKNNTNDLLQKILAKRKNLTVDVEHPADEPPTIEVKDYEIKE